MSTPTVLAWRNRYDAGGIGALVDLPRSSRPPVIGEAAVVTRTLNPPPDEMVEIFFGIITRRPDPHQSFHHRAWSDATMMQRRTLVRWLPLVLLTTLLVVYAAYSKQPDDPFRFQRFHLIVDLSPAALAAATTKVPHWVHFGLTLLLAHLALERRSLLPAFALTMMLGILVELEEAWTGRAGKVADLAPDALGAGCAVLLVLVVRWLRGRRPAAADPADPPEPTAANPSARRTAS